ncbi:MAG: hypothetical protein HY681_12660 [Chloroflexi bacterium]|nr:hypothetical protein [Chloroflexota bacterium]
MPFFVALMTARMFADDFPGIRGAFTHQLAQHLHNATVLRQDIGVHELFNSHTPPAIVCGLRRSTAVEGAPVICWCSSEPEGRKKRPSPWKSNQKASTAAFSSARCRSSPFTFPSTSAQHTAPVMWRPSETAARTH